MEGRHLGKLVGGGVREGGGGAGGREGRQLGEVGKGGLYGRSVSVCTKACTSAVKNKC